MVLLEGDLGAGKSELARGGARGLGIQGPVPSPSFTILNAYDEYAICWRGGKVFLLALLGAAAAVFGMVGQDNPVFFIGAAVAILWIFIIHWKQSMKLAAAFGKGPLYGLFLFLFYKLGRVVLGLSAAEYVGKR